MSVAAHPREDASERLPMAGVVRKAAPSNGIQRRSKIPKKKSHLMDIYPSSKMPRRDGAVLLEASEKSSPVPSSSAVMQARNPKMWDTYPVYDKRDCPHKAKSNGILVDMGRDVPCRSCLVLDAATHLTTLKLLETGWYPKDIHVPNACEDAYDALRSSGNCRAYKMSVSDFMSECRETHNVQMFGTIYLDYCTTLDGGYTRYNTSPRYDIQELFRLNLISPEGCVLAVTLCKPKDDETHEPQFSKLRHLLTAMCLKYRMAIVFHSESNSYDNWHTEFYTIGQMEHMRRFFRMTEESAQEAAQRRQQRQGPTNHQSSSTRSVSPADLKIKSRKEREVIVLDDDDGDDDHLDDAKSDHWDEDDWNSHVQINYEAKCNLNEADEAGSSQEDQLERDALGEDPLEDGEIREEKGGETNGGERIDTERIESGRIERERMESERIKVAQIESEIVESGMSGKRREEENKLENCENIGEMVDSVVEAAPPASERVVDTIETLPEHLSEEESEDDDEDEDIIDLTVGLT
mmetsp:Transcript_3442/g.6419  ORF Transcript_3442/g.6419 Transcript_3442/m.6419 type:complete len:522 (-) Transcript_3442:49-1614(-)